MMSAAEDGHRARECRVTETNSKKLHSFSLCFLLTGLFGLFLSAIISTRYMETLPTSPDPDNLRMTPRNINGSILYETEEEDRMLDVTEYCSVGIFLIGAAAGLVYLQKWGLARAIESHDEEFISEEG
jgi:hypothetical protein